jgi:hypothetical protein
MLYERAGSGILQRGREGREKRGKGRGGNAFHSSNKNTLCLYIMYIFTCVRR